MSLLRWIILGTALFAILARHATAQERVVISDVTVVDATGAAPRAHVVVVVDRGRIVEIGPASSRSFSSDARIVDGRGKFLIPGLWDMHVHLAKAGAHTLPLFVANGVTGVRSAGGDFEAVKAMRDEVARGLLEGPRIKTAGPILESGEKYDRLVRSGTIEPVARSRVPISDSASAVQAVDSLASLGVDFIKFRTVPSVAAYRAMAAAAHRANLALVGHGDAVPLEEMMRARQRSIEHPILWPLHWKSPARRRALVRELVAADVAIVPTMVVFHRFVMTPRHRALAVVDDSLARLDHRRRYVCCYLIEDWREQLEDLGGRVSLRRPVYRAIYGAILKDLRELHRTGAVIMPGTDVAVAMIYPGYNLHDELWYFVSEVGMTPMQALMSATRVPAEWFGMRDSLGTIEVGKIADLVLLEADPLADIRNTKRIAGVMLRGRYLDRPALDALLERVASEVRSATGFGRGASVPREEQRK